MTESPGVAAAQMHGRHLHAAQIDRQLVVEHDAGRAGLLVPDHVLAHVAMRDDLGEVDEVGVAARVVGVMVRVQQVLDRQRADALDPVENVLGVLRELVVDDDQANRA
jgi:hypothetical protein